MVARLIDVQTIFKRVLDIVRIKVGRSKNKWESFGILDSNELDIEGFKAAQRKRQNITEAYTSDLGVPEALFSCSLSFLAETGNTFVCYDRVDETSVTVTVLLQRTNSCI